MTTAWLGFVAFDIANGTKTVQQAMRDFFIAGLVVVALQAGQYTQYVSNLFLQALPNTIGQAMGGTASPGRFARHGVRYHDQSCRTHL